MKPSSKEKEFKAVLTPDEWAIKQLTNIKFLPDGKLYWFDRTWIKPRKKLKRVPPMKARYLMLEAVKRNYPIIGMEYLDKRNRKETENV